jgi:alpha-beta hydrolase superfamily lysophospholipase
MMTSFDGLKLYTKAWIPPQYKAIICLIHGYGEHVNRYNHVAEFFNKNEYAFVGMDTRGYGQSEGKRGHAPNFEAFMTDIEQFIGETKKQYPNKPIFLYGHSMGGNFVLNYVIRKKPHLAGVIVTGPLIQTAFKTSAFQIGLAKFARSIFPTLSQSTKLVSAHISKDPAVVAAYDADPLVFDSMSAAAGAGILEANAFLDNYSGEMPVPLLIMHADEDKLTSQPASAAFEGRLKGDTTYKKWVGMYHEIHNEPDKQRVFDYALGWLDSKV